MIGNENYRRWLLVVKKNNEAVMEDGIATVIGQCEIWAILEKRLEITPSFGLYCIIWFQAGGTK